MFRRLNNNRYINNIINTKTALFSILTVLVSAIVVIFSLVYNVKVNLYTCETIPINIDELINTDYIIRIIVKCAHIKYSSLQVALCYVR